MKAIVQYQYGGVETLSIEEVQKPVINDNGILIKIKAVNIASGDMKVNTMSVPKILKPILRLVFGWNGPRKKIRGISAAGTIEEVGKNVTKFFVGDDVYFINSMGASCLTEYILLSEKSVMTTIPDGMKCTEAAPVAFGAMSAFYFINGDTIKENDKVLVYGASGSVGSYAVQLAKYFGANVSGVSSRKNHSVLKSLGCDEVIDYTTQDISQINKEYDVVFDAVGKLSKKDAKTLLKDNGSFLSIKRPTTEKVSSLEALNGIFERSGFRTYIEKVYSFVEYKEAHQHVYDGHKVGNVVIKVEDL